MTKVVKAYQKDFPGEVTKLAHTAEETAKDVAKDVTVQADKVSKSMQKVCEPCKRGLPREVLLANDEQSSGF